MKGTSLTKLSKVFHVTAFSYLIWLLTLIIGMLAPNLITNDVFSTNSSYLLEGLLFVAGFRICMFKSVFGSSLVRAILVGLVAPFTILFSLLHFNLSRKYFLTQLRLDMGWG